MQALVYVQELPAKDQMFLVGSINMFSLFCEFLFQWWRTPHGQHLGSKGKNMDIKHILNRTDFWGGGNHVSSIDVWGRCNDRIALGQTFFFVVKKTPTVFEFWDLAHPPPKKKNNLQVLLFLLQPISTSHHQKIHPPRFSFLVLLLSNAQVWSWTPSWTHRLDGSFNSDCWLDKRFLKVVRTTSGKWRHEGLEPDILFVTLLEKGDQLWTKVWPKIVGEIVRKKSGV